MPTPVGFTIINPAEFGSNRIWKIGKVLDRTYQVVLFGHADQQGLHLDVR